ncbi:hypothetical protein [Hydrogenimonas sp.]
MKNVIKRKALERRGYEIVFIGGMVLIACIVTKKSGFDRALPVVSTSPI